MALTHSDKQLKQHYEYRAQSGIKPGDPLGEADFKGITVPTELF